MSTHLKFCGCKWCKGNRHKVAKRKRDATFVTKSARHKWNQLAKEGRDEEITPVSMPYTD